jgi:hypothetical protein
MIAYQDFVPRQLTKAALFQPANFETLRASLLAANRWIEEHGVRVLNIETVVLPNIHHSWEEGSEDTALHASGELRSSWHQFIRVWYERPKDPAAPPRIPSA